MFCPYCQEICLDIFELLAFSHFWSLLLVFPQKWLYNGVT